MIRKIIIPFLIAMGLLVLQIVVLPYIAVKGILPNILLIYILFYSLRYGQVQGMVFAFFVGIIFDYASSELIGSGMFAFTLAAFVAGYFYKEDFNITLQNIKLLVFTFLLSATLFFFSYSVLGSASETKFGYFFFSVLSAAYTTLLALIVYFIPRKNYE